MKKKITFCKKKKRKKEEWNEEEDEEEEKDEKNADEKRRKCQETKKKKKKNNYANKQEKKRKKYVNMHTVIRTPRSSPNNPSFIESIIIEKHRCGKFAEIKNNRIKKKKGRWEKRHK